LELPSSDDVQRVLILAILKKSHEENTDKFVAIASGKDDQNPSVFLQAAFGNGFSIADGNRLYQISNFAWNRDTKTIFVRPAAKVRHCLQILNLQPS
jgi:hypothetical protein